MADDVFAEAFQRLGAVVRAGVTAGPKVLDQLGAELDRAIKQELSKPGTGRTYRSRRGGKVLHQASAAGAPPAVDLGEYRASWTWKVAGLVLDFFTPDVRGPWLEHGTSKMAARPHLRTVMEKAVAKIPAFIAARIEQAQRAVAGRAS